MPKYLRELGTNNLSILLVAIPTALRQILLRICPSCCVKNTRRCAASPVFFALPKEIIPSQNLTSLFIPNSLTFLFIFFHSILFSQTTFLETAETIGINHQYQNLQLMGGGVAVFDFDNDGWEDLWINGGAQPDMLFKNIGNGTFSTIGMPDWLGDLADIPTTAVAIGDINNDGFRDVFLTTREGFSNILLKNNGNGSFTDISNNSSFPQDTTWCTSASFGDINLDGCLDIFVGNYVKEAGFLYDSMTNTIYGYDHDCFSNLLYLNNGDETFTEVASILEVDASGCVLASTFTDFDNDADSDLLIANDFGEWIIPNHLFQNNGDGNPFTDISATTGMDIGIYAMGIAVGDYDRDLDLDYYITNLGRNVLLENDGNGYFNDQTEFANIEDTYVGSLLTVGWGTGFLDIDNDSDLDLFVANGYIGALSFNATSFYSPDKLFLNNGDKTFTDVSLESGVENGAKARGFAFFDFDKDGDNDLVVVPVNKTPDSVPSEKVLFYENALANGHNWLQVKLQGTINNRDAYGAHIKIVVDSLSWIHEVNGSGSHASQHSSIAHFGLGQSELVDSLIVTWPGGKQQDLVGIFPNQFITIIEDSTLYSNIVDKNSAIDFDLSAQPNPFSDKTLITFKNDLFQPFSIDILNSAGQLLKKINGIRSESYELERADFAKGIYFLKLCSPNGAVETMRLLVL